MSKVGIRELKNRLSAYVRRAQKGERMAITDRGEVVAELVPASRAEGALSGLDELARRGELTLAVSPTSQRRDAIYPAMPMALRDGSAAELLNAERDDR